MSEVELRIKPTLVGSVGSDFRKLGGQAARFGDAQRTANTRAERSARKLEGAYDRIGNSLVSMARGGGLAGRALGQLHNIAIGLSGLARGGGTIGDMLIGSNERLEASRLTFNTLVGDVDKASKLISGLRAQAAATPFAEEDILEAGKRLLRSTGSNIELNMQLVEQAQTLAALNPERTVTDAAEAILDAQLGEFERLKEFSIKLRKKDLDKAVKSGTELGTAAVDAIQARIKDMGAEGLVDELSTSFKGRKSTFIDTVKKVFQETGEEAFGVLSQGLVDIQEDFQALRADPQFRQDMTDLSRIIADAAKMSIELVRKLPSAVRSLREFVEEHKTAIGIGVGLFAANKLTGGGLVEGGVALGRRALFGKRGGGVGALSGIGGDVQPVHVVNFPSGLGGGDGGQLQRAVSQKAGGGKFTPSQLGKFGGGGLVGQIGVGGVAAGGAILGSFMLAAATFVDVTQRTQGIIERAEKRGQFFEKQAQAPASERVAARVAQARREQEVVNLQQRTGGFRQALDVGDIPGAVSAAQGALERGGGSKEGNAAVVRDLNMGLEAFGLEASVKGGRVKFKQREGLTRRLHELTEFDRQLQSNPQAAQQLDREGKLSGLVAEAEQLATLRGRAESVGKALNQVRVEKGAVVVNIVGTGDAAKDAATAVARSRRELEKQLETLTKREGQNR